MRFKNAVKSNDEKNLESPVIISNGLTNTSGNDIITNFQPTIRRNSSSQRLISKQINELNASSSCPLPHLPVKTTVKLKNFTNSQQFNDSLHHSSVPIKCSGHVCIGSLMSGQTRPAKPGELTNDEILEQAYDFIEQYFIYSKKNNSEELSKRMEEISYELETTGTYTLSLDELNFGAKSAWRNASRCIGRIQWNKLILNDARNIKTTKDMFNAICKHIKEATNGGNIRSTITVFPQRIPGREDFRVWSPQLISFAGYLQPDGSVIGDPARIQFTKVCQRLGWRGKGGAFDVLPIVISSPGEGVKFFELPEDLILIVKLEHPKYSWFSDLNLKWYALPAVSDMMFEVGGLQFTAAPFNGWYMGTEIGARDLCDVQRYNITQKVADKMGLDTSSPSSLWKDQVLVEVNIAVLYSFQKNNVTIVDHHTASENFLHHMNNEQKQRGGCPADWVWIVPPMSGSITGVYHQEMINYSLKPSFEYQEPAWKNYVWGKSKIQLKHKFSTIAKVTLTMIKLMSNVLEKRVKLSIIYATETGKSENFSHKLSKIMQTWFKVNVKSMESYTIEHLRNEVFAIFVVSTFGNGEPPDNGKEFWKNLHNSSIDLSSLKYAVFALGSTQYPTFCAFGKNLNKALKDLNAKCISDIAFGDELSGQEKAFNRWKREVYRKSCDEFNLKISDQQNEEELQEKYLPDNFRLCELDSVKFDSDLHLNNELSRIHKKKAFPCKIISRIRLQPESTDKQTLLIKLKPGNPLAKNYFKYLPGDHLGIFPKNPTEMVDSLLSKIIHFGYTDPDIVYKLEMKNENNWIQNQRLPPCTLRTALTYFLDITTPPRPIFLGYLAQMANDRWDSFRLQRLASDMDEYKKWRIFHSPTLNDVFNEFPSVHVDPEFLLTQLPLLQPRYYSVSSSQSVNPDEVHLTMTLVSYKVSDGKGSKRFGLCTGYIDKFPVEDIHCFIRSAPNFRLPIDGNLPIIMICAGSGIAPFRSFWQERESQLQKYKRVGKMILFYGCRNSKSDHIYENELNDLMNKRIINEVFLAYSREPGQKKRYVQDEVHLQRGLIYWLINNEKAHIYVCGDPMMADGVKQSLVKCFIDILKIDKQQADDKIEELFNENRYHEDVFSAIHHIS